MFDKLTVVLLLALSISSPHLAAAQLQDAALAQPADATAVAADRVSVDAVIPRPATPDITKDPGWPIVSTYFQSGDSALGCSKTIVTATNDSALREFSDGTFYACSDGVVSRCKSLSSASLKYNGIPCYYSPLKLTSYGDDEQWVYADGVLLGYQGGWYNSLTVTIPSPTQVIAVKIMDQMLVGGFIGTFSDGSVTDSSWRCTRKFYDGWNAPGYDDSFWPLATATKLQPDPIWGTLAGEAANARFIWAGSYSTTNAPVTVYCRKRINYCLPQPIDKCISYQCNVSPVVVLCDGKWVKVVQLPNWNLYQTCNTVKCRNNCDSCGCGRCVTSKTTCNLLVYWPTTTGTLGVRFCRVPVPGCCNAQCYGVPSL